MGQHSRVSAGFIGRVGVPLVIALLFGLLPALSASAQDLSIAIDPVGPVTSGSQFDVTARLVGASATDIARGIDWTLVGPSVSINGWDVSTDESDYRERSPNRYMGTTAVFTVYAGINGTYTFDIQARLAGSKTPTVVNAPLEVQVASPDALTVPEPPAYVNLETQGIESSIPATIAYFQAKIDIDPAFTPRYFPYRVSLNSGIPRKFSPELQYTEVANFLTSGGSSPWFDLAVDWRASKTPLRVSISTVIPDRELNVSYSRSLEMPQLNFSREAVLEVFPPKVIGRCIQQKKRVLCDAGVLNSEGLESRLLAVPQEVPVKIQVGAGKSPRSKIKWGPPVILEPTLNNEYRRKSIRIPASVIKKGDIFVRMEAQGYPKSARVFGVATNQPLDDMQFQRGRRS